MQLNVPAELGHCCSARLDQVGVDAAIGNGIDANGADPTIMQSAQFNIGRGVVDEGNAARPVGSQSLDSI